MLAFLPNCGRVILNLLCFVVFKWSSGLLPICLSLNSSYGFCDLKTHVTCLFWKIKGKFSDRVGIWWRLDLFITYWMKHGFVLLIWVILYDLDGWNFLGSLLDFTWICICFTVVVIFFIFCMLYKFYDIGYRSFNNFVVRDVHKLN